MSHFRITILALAALASGVSAQSGGGIGDSPPLASSRWQAEVRMLDAVLRDRALTASEPRRQWVAGVIERGDPSARIAYLAEARRKVPRERLYVSTLALACLEPFRPLPPACDEMDRLADWSTRDDDNGLPALLLAERAQARNNVMAAIAQLEDGATRPGFDDYFDRGAIFIWDEVRALPGPAEPAARVELAARYGLSLGAQGLRGVDALCRGSVASAQNLRVACHRAGRALAARGATWSLRLAGARLAERAAPTAEALALAQQQLAEMRALSLACAAAGDTVAAALESADADLRSRAALEWEARIQRNAENGEVAACARRGPN